jgi:hypothetical protein
MIRFFRQWFLTLDEVERDLRDQGYLTVFTGGTSFVIPLKIAVSPPPQRSKKQDFVFWPTIPAIDGMEATAAYQLTK